MKIGLLAFTDKAKSLATRIKENLDGELRIISVEELQNSFHNYMPINSSFLLFLL